MDVANIVDTTGRVLDYEIISIGNTPLTLASILAFVLVFLGFLVVARVLAAVVRRWMFRRIDVERGVGYALSRVVQYATLAVGFFISFQFLGIDVSSLAIFLGALGVGIGLGLQNLTANFISGLLLLFERPIVVGDRVTVGVIEGDVESINMRATTVRSIDNTAVIIPNRDFVEQQVVNWSHGDRRQRLDIDVGVSYDSDVQEVVAALIEAGSSHPRVLSYPEPDVLLMGFGDSAWDMRLRVWIPDPKDHIVVRSDINKAVVAEFRKRGVEIPFPQRDVHWRSPLPFQVEGSS